MALGRVICFLPFFLLGYYCTKERVAKIRKMPKLISVAIIIATAAISAYFAISRVFRVEILYLRRPYPEDLQLKSMLCRLVVYIVAISMITATMNLMTSKKTFLSTIGTSTMTVYILHLFTIPLLEKYEIFEGHPNLYLIYSILMTVTIVFIYTRPVVVRGYDKMMDKLSGIILKTKKK